MNLSGQSQITATAQAIEVAIRLGVVFLILAACMQILAPFVSVIAWGAIIAIAIHTPFLKLVDKLAGRKKLAAMLVAAISIAIILIPVVSLSSSLVDGITTLGTHFSDGKVVIAPPSESVRDWPLIGKKSYALWQQASVDLSSLLQKYPHELSAIGKKLLAAVAGVGFGMLQFVISMIIAAVFLTSADVAQKSMCRLANRLSPNGEALLTMSVNTIRSVSVGVVGIAFIQAVLGGLGMMFVDIPGAGLLAVVILVLGIAQLPPLLVLLPVSIYVFSVETTTVAVIFLVWSIMVSLSDAVLKPLLLGRGVDAPMLVILLGAIGGMLAYGVVGLFIGAVILAVGYKLFQAWIALGDPVPDSETEIDSAS